jgi:uncharacterized membrane protein YphA (DoxX/SURF4 family)
MITEVQKQQNASVVSLLIRLVLATVFSVAGITKLVNIVSHGYGGWIETFTSGFKGVFLYAWPFKALLYVFAVLLPWLETAVGLTLFAGFKTRPMLLVCAFLLGFLTFGMALKGDPATVANNAQFVVFAALAYYFSLYGNNFSLDALLTSK